MQIQVNDNILNQAISITGITNVEDLIAEALGIYILCNKEDQVWTQSFNTSQLKLENLADEALKDFHNGKVIEADWDQL